MPAHMLAGAPPIFLTIASDQTDYDIGAYAGGSGVRRDVVLTINSGVVVYQTAAAAALLIGSPWVAGSTLKIINNGTICGHGGDAGAGHATLQGDGFNGAPGLNAMQLNNTNVAVTIDNTNGYIFGGGGGGGGGCGSPAGGGGGGGGRGRLGGAGGANGAPSGFSGTAGSFSAAGLGYTANAYDGGDGGDWGQPGIDGDDDSGGGFTGGGGGAAGKAISLGSAPAPTWLGGNNSTHVKGLVS